MKRKKAKSSSISFFDNLAKIFIDQSDSYMKKFEQAIENEDFKTAGEAMHLLKSSSGSLGATRLFKICDHIENICRSGDAEQMKLNQLKENLKYELNLVIKKFTDEMKKI